MTDLICHIDEQISSCIDDAIVAFGLCHQVDDNGAVYPATVSKEATRVSPDNRTQILTYHRLLNGQVEPREDLSFGRKATRQNSQQVRMVVFIDLECSQSIIDDIINGMPDDFLIEGYRYCNVSSSIDLIRDRSSIWGEEFGEAYQAKYQKRFQIYAVEYSLEYIKCPVCETSP